MKKILINLLLLSSFVISGCSTMFNGDDQSMTIRTPNDEKGIKVEIKTNSGSYSTQLPATVTASPSNEGVAVTVLDNCFDRTTTYVKKNISPSYWANLLNGWGFLIDWATGKMWKYDRDTSIYLNKKANC